MPKKSDVKEVEIDPSLDQDVCKQMTSLVELLTTSGKPILNPEVMKKFKKLCRTSDAYVEHAFRLLMAQLSKNHAEIRLSTFQMIDELFTRSHAFRELLLAYFQTFLELAVGTDINQPLPPPKAVAQNLKSEAYKCIQGWFEKYGQAYKQLELGYQYLKNCKKVDFDGIQARTELERRQKEEAERKVAESRKIKLEKVLNELNELSPDIDLCLKELDSGIQLLMPHPEDFFIPTENTDTANCDLPSPHSKKTQNDQTDSIVKNDHSKGQSQNGSSGLKNNDKNVLKEEDKIKCKHKADDCDAKKEVDISRELCSNQSSDGQNVTRDSSEKVDENLASSGGMVSESSENVSSQTDNGNNKELNDDVSEDEDEEEDGDDDDFEDVGPGPSFTQEHGLFTRQFEITIKMDEVERRFQETEDNKAIVQTVKDQYKLVKTKYLPRVRHWLQVMGQCGASEKDLKRLIDLRGQMEDIAKKCLELEVVCANEATDQDSDSEEEFEDVPDKDGYEDDIPEHVKLEAARAAVASTSSKKRRKPRSKSTKPSKVKRTAKDWLLSERLESEDVKDPTSWKCNVEKILQKSRETAPSKSRTKTIKEEPMDPDEPGTSKTTLGAGSQSTNGPDRKQSLLEKAPVVSFGVDLEHWENPDEITAPEKVKYDDASRFWVPKAEGGEEKQNKEEVAALVRRTMTFVGEFEPIKWKCRAPMSNGQLCERMDRDKCPFHGKVIGRDKEGIPTDPADLARMLAEKVMEKGSNSSASDSEPSGSKGKGKGKGKGKKTKYPNLTDIKEVQTSRDRLEAKIFNKSTMKRVNSALDRADMKRVSDKFANQFTYSLK